jgi:hypothetical protein
VTLLKTERTMAVVGILLLIMTALIQFADSKVSDFQNDLVIRQGRLNNLLLYKLEMRMNEFNANQMEILNPKINVSPMIPGLNEQRLNEKQEDSRSRYEKGEISSREFFHEQRKFFASEYDSAGVRYQSELRDANSTSIKGSPWEWWAKIFGFFQVGLIILNLWLVFNLSAQQGAAADATTKRPRR